MTEVNEHMQDWLDALRSGEYQQGHGVMKRCKTDGTCEYCCMGVALELAGVEFVQDTAFGRAEEAGVEVYGWKSRGHSGWTNQGTMPGWLTELLGLQSSIGLAWLNDTKRLSFAGIADRLEAHVTTGAALEEGLRTE